SRAASPRSARATPGSTETALSNADISPLLSADQGVLGREVRDAHPREPEETVELAPPEDALDDPREDRGPRRAEGHGGHVHQPPIPRRERLLRVDEPGAAPAADDAAAL